MLCDGERARGGPLPDAIGEAVAAALEDGAGTDEIVARIRGQDGERRPAGWLARLIGLQRETERIAEEWARTRAPGAEGRSALLAIGGLRTLTLCAIAELSQRAEPVSTEELGRLALTLNRIERADTRRVGRERAVAEADADPGRLAARAARMTYDERLEMVRRSLREHRFPERADPPPPEPGWAAVSPAESRDTPPPAPAPHPPADGGAEDGRDAPGAQDAWDAREAHDAWDARRAQDFHMRRREAEGQLWPTDPPFCPSHWSGPG